MARVAWIRPASAPRAVLERLQYDHETMEIVAGNGEQAAVGIERAAKAGAEVYVLEASCLDAADNVGMRATAAAMAATSTATTCWPAVHASGRENGLHETLRKLTTYGGVRAIAVDNTLADPYGYLSRACAHKPPAVETGAWVAAANDLPDMGGKRRERIEPLRMQPAVVGTKHGKKRARR